MANVQGKLSNTNPKDNHYTAIELLTLNHQTNSDLSPNSIHVGTSIWDSKPYTKPSSRYGKDYSKFNLDSIEKSNFFSFIHFFFTIKLINLINSFTHRFLSESDLTPPNPSQDSQYFESQFTKTYKELQPSHPKKFILMFLVIAKIFRKDIYIQLACQTVFVVSRMLIGYFLFLSLKSIRDKAQPIANAYPPAVGMFICFLVGLYTNHHFSFNIAYASNKMKIGILGMIFKKLNNLSLAAMQKTSIGKVINVVADDANQLENLHFVLSIFIAPIAYGCAIGILYHFWGASCFAGLGYMAVVIILPKKGSDWTIQPGIRRLILGDERIRRINELLQSIRVIKMLTWEFPIINLINKMRIEEIKELKTIYYVQIIPRAFVYSSHYIAAFFILLTYTQTGHVLTADRVFPTLLLLSHLRQVGMMHVANGFTNLIMMLVLFNRTMAIMDLPEVQPQKELKPPKKPENSIEYQDFSGFWVNRDLDPPAFVPHTKPSQNPPQEVSPFPAVSDVNLEVQKGSLVAVIGQVGSGKSSLLLSFTREMAKTQGELRYKGKFEYVSQEPIFLSMSVKESITFGKVYDDELFWKVVEACCLTEEIKSLPKQENTQISERASNLNGEQRIRITLARSLYTKADIYLLDDPLGGLNKQLGKLVFKKAIQEFLKDATVVLVANELDFAKHANKMVVMDKGKILVEGTYAELVLQDIDNVMINELKERAKYDSEKVAVYAIGRQFSEVYRPSLVENRIQVQEEINQPEEGVLDLVKAERGLMIDNELIADGKVTLKIYWKYFTAIFSWWNILFAAVLFTAAEAVGWQFMIRTSYWTQHRLTQEEAYEILAGIAFGGLGVHAIKFLLFHYLSIEASHKLSDKMVKGVTLSHISFFDRNRSGWVLNRFANDISIMDKLLPAALLEILEGLCLFLVYSIALWVTQPWILVPAAIAATFFVLVSWYCLKAVNQTRGLELTTRGPLYSFFSIISSGLPIIRARNLVDSVMNAFYRRADDYSKANLSYKVTIRFMNFLMDYITELTVIGTFCVYIHAKENPIVSGPFVNMLLLLPNTMSWLLRNFMNLHALMASPARIINYCKSCIEIEQVKANDSKLKEQGWPKEGKIEVKNATMRYRKGTEPTIKNLSFKVEHGEKVAIVGTGITSLVQLLIKMFEVDKTGTEAYVKIDGINVNDVGVQLLRKSITVIPQSHFVFTTTIRNNLDPWGEHSDAELWKVLELTTLKPFIEGMTKKLDTFVGKDSSVLSTGQKQLLSVARALLRKSRILIEDNATSHVDVITDQIVQKKIKEEFAQVTSLASTFQIWDIADFDKLLFLKNGVDVEFDEPYRLLVNEIGDLQVTNKQGHFASMVLNLGIEVEEHVFKTAMTKYYEKHNLTLPSVIPSRRKSLTKGKVIP